MRLMSDARHLTRYPIKPVGKVFHLEDRRGRRISLHRTVTGALRARRELLQQEQDQRP